MTITRKLLSRGDDKYIEVCSLFDKHNATKDFHFVVEGIEIVVNEKLWERFEEKKTEYENLYGHVRVVKVFHGTKRANIRSILSKNLEVHRHGQNVGHRFGAGVSFSSQASYASHYCDKEESNNQMLLCYVLVSNIIEVEERIRQRQPVLTRPPLLDGHHNLRYDTTAKNKRTMNVIVKFEDHTFYPAFVVHFKRLPKFPATSCGLPVLKPSLNSRPQASQRTVSPPRQPSPQHTAEHHAFRRTGPSSQASAGHQDTPKLYAPQRTAPSARTISSTVEVPESNVPKLSLSPSPYLSQQTASVLRQPLSPPRRAGLQEQRVSPLCRPLPQSVAQPPVFSSLGPSSQAPGGHPDTPKLYAPQWTASSARTYSSIVKVPESNTPKPLLNPSFYSSQRSAPVPRQPPSLTERREGLQAFNSVGPCSQISTARRQAAPTLHPPEQPTSFKDSVRSFFRALFCRGN